MSENKMSIIDILRELLASLISFGGCVILFPLYVLNEFNVFLIQHFMEAFYRLSLFVAPKDKDE